MRAGNKLVHDVGGEQEDVLREELNALVNVRLFDGDIRRGLEFVARCHIRRIVQSMEEEYKEKHQVSELPDMMDDLMRTRAYLNYARHCACLMKDLKLAAFDPQRGI